MQNHSLPSKRAWLWPAVIAVLIFAASSRSHLAGPEGVPSSDKVTHFAVYGLLATLVVRLGRGWKSAVVTVLAVSLYGASDEWHQSFTPGRSVELADWLADTTGGALAAALYAGWPRYRRCLEGSVLFSRRQVEKGVAGISVPKP